MYYNRSLSRIVFEASRNFPVLLLTGPRQVGKTTLLLKLSEQESGIRRTYISLDDPVIRQLAVNDPALFMQRYEGPLLIDEIQYAPQLLPYIKMAADTHKKKGEFWLTGSQIFHLMKGVSESLAGRIAILRLQSLSNSEIEERESIAFTTDPVLLMKKMKVSHILPVSEVFARILRGGMPALYENPAQETERFFSSYIQTYIQRDIRELTQVADELLFFRFLQVVASHTAAMLVYENIAKETGISAPTAKQWLSILLTTGIVILIPPFFSNVLKRIVKAPRLYFLDTGLCAHLLKWSSAAVLETGAMSGAFYETWVVSEIYKSYLNDGKEAPLFYYRDSDQKEIDLLLYSDNTLYPIEIKKTATPDKSMTRHFSVLRAFGAAAGDINGQSGQVTPAVGNGALVCQVNDVIPLETNTWCVPSSIL